MTYQREWLNWPIAKHSEALAYCGVADAAYATFVNEPGGVFCYCRPDRHSNWITPFYSPTGWGSEQEPGPPEPSECLAARADATLVTFIEWPNED